MLMIAADDVSYHTQGEMRSDKLCVILNSRQSKRPCNKDRWLKATIQAVSTMVENNHIVLTSLGMNTWEILIHLVNVLGGRQLIILPEQSGVCNKNIVDSIIADFKLRSAKASFLFFEPKVTGIRGGKYYFSQRDRLAVEHANLIVPITVRPKGNIENLVAESALLGKDILHDFEIDYTKPVDSIKYSFKDTTINPALTDEHWQYITHWTRSSHLPYPAETRFDYYDAIINSESYPHSAFDTLVRIVTEGVIRGSSRFTRGGHSVVSFTSLGPFEATKLMRWRRRYVTYTFEPYGVAIESECAREIGVRDVIYGDTTLYGMLPDADKPFYQNKGSDKADWLPECELRYRGNLDLSIIPQNKIKLITYTCREAERIAALSPFEVVPLTIED